MHFQAETPQGSRRGPCLAWCGVRLHEETPQGSILTATDVSMACGQRRPSSSRRTGTAVFASPKGPSSWALGGGQTSCYSFHYHAQQSSVRTYCVCAWPTLVLRSPDPRECSPLTALAHEGLSSQRLPERPAPQSGWQRTCPWK